MRYARSQANRARRLCYRGGTVILNNCPICSVLRGGDGFGARGEGFVNPSQQTPHPAAPFRPGYDALALAASLLVSYAQARGETVNVSGSGGLMQRAERLVLSCLACLLDAPLTAYFGWPQNSVLLAVLWIVAVGAFGTAIHRTIWIARKLREGQRSTSS